MWIRMNGLPLCGVGCERISPGARRPGSMRSEEHTSELQSRSDLVCRLLLEKKKKKKKLPRQLQEITHVADTQEDRHARVMSILNPHEILTLHHVHEVDDGRINI